MGNECFLQAVQEMANRAPEVVLEHNAAMPEDRVEEVRWCLASGGAYRHPDVSKLDVAQQTLLGMRLAGCAGLRAIFAFDEDVLRRAHEGLTAPE